MFGNKMQFEEGGSKEERERERESIKEHMVSCKTIKVLIVGVIENNIYLYSIMSRQCLYKNKKAN